MGERTGIEWATATWNPWMGCHKVSPGCKFCYAERDMNRGNCILGKGSMIRLTIPKELLLINNSFIIDNNIISLYIATPPALSWCQIVRRIFNVLKAPLRPSLI